MRCASGGHGAVDDSCSCVRRLMRVDACMWSCVGGVVSVFGWSGVSVWMGVRVPTCWSERVRAYKSSMRSWTFSCDIKISDVIFLPSTCLHV